MDSKLLLIVALATALTAVTYNNQSSSHVEAFEAFKARHNKVYSTDAEEALRFATYMSNM
jgi:hypothetical protein